MNECYDCGGFFRQYGECSKCGSSNVSLEMDGDIVDEEDDEESVLAELRLDDDVIVDSIWDDDEDLDELEDDDD